MAAQRHWQWNKGELAVYRWRLVSPRLRWERHYCPLIVNCQAALRLWGAGLGWNRPQGLM